MLELHGWLTIYPTFMDEDKHPEIDEEKIYKEVEKIVSESKYNIFEKIKHLNVTDCLDISYCSNRSNLESQEIIDTFKKIASVATGSYGIIYLWDDEDEEYYNDFRVLVIKRGVCTWEKDIYFSPCTPTISDEYV